MRILVIGHGIAGATVAWELKRLGAHVVVAASSVRPSATRKAAGLINPVVLKRLNKVWYSEEALGALDFYRDVASQLKEKESFIRPIAMQQRFPDVSYGNNWSILESEPTWSRDLGEVADGRTWSGLQTPYGSAPLKRVWMVDSIRLLDTLERWHREHFSWRDVTLNKDDLILDSTGWMFGEERFNAVVWANGTAILESSYWSSLPIRPNYGTWIQLPQPTDVPMSLDEGFHSEFFILPKWVGGIRMLQIGSTYSPNQAESPESNVDRLVNNLHAIRVEPSVELDLGKISRVDGIRPTSADRRPMYGQHPSVSSAYCAAALGSRGLLHAPIMARALAQLILNKSDDIPVQANVCRFSRRLRDCT